ncbi:18547_t:CDS:2, partial [Racocetra persica]
SELYDHHLQEIKARSSDILGLAIDVFEKKDIYGPDIQAHNSSELGLYSTDLNYNWVKESKDRYFILLDTSIFIQQA